MSLNCDQYIYVHTDRHGYYNYCSFFFVAFFNHYGVLSMQMFLLSFDAVCYIMPSVMKMMSAVNMFIVEMKLIGRNLVTALLS